MSASRFPIRRCAAMVLIMIIALAAYTNMSNRVSAANSTAFGGVVSRADLASERIGNLPPPFAKQLAFRNTMRKLWEDHITWTRMFIVSVAAGLPDRDPTAGRLLQNQTDLGNAIKPFYGDAAGAQFTALLRDHILIAVDLLDAAKAGDMARFNDALARWYANANEIAAFLHSLNPDNWPLADMQAMMRAHLDRTLEEAVARLHGDWAADIAAYDRVHQQALEMADMLSIGIIRQFPNKFT